ncbi:MAG: DUF5118 domain-containing protein, partial [Cyclobacteriaceae bacterium]|nr:DUF5118 domain-containing protein [Cyclobacteriaceae bacterium]
MMKNKIFLLPLLFLLLFQLPTSAQKKKKGKNTESAEKSEKPKDKSAMKSYKEIITDKAITNKGLFTTHKEGDKYYFEIPDTLLEREMLVVSRISGTIKNFNFGGAGMKARGQQVWRWQRKDNKILLRSVSFNSVASEDKPIYESVRNNNFEPIIMSFDIKAINNDSTGVVIEVNELYASDVPSIGPLRA